MRAAGGGYGIDRAQIGQVKHGRGMEPDGAFGISDDAVEHIGPQVPMRQHHSFGTAGGAAGVEQADQVIDGGLFERVLRNRSGCRGSCPQGKGRCRRR